MFTLSVNRITTVLNADQPDILNKMVLYFTFTAGNSGTMIILELCGKLLLTFPLKVAALVFPKRALITTIVLLIIAPVYNILVGIIADVTDKIGPLCSAVR